MTKLEIGELLIMKADVSYPEDDVIIYKVAKGRRSNTEFRLNIINEGYWNYGERWYNTKQILKDYRRLTPTEQLLYV